jgi:hypothetical protein
MNKTQKTKASGRWRVATLSLPITWILWVMISVVFFLLSLVSGGEIVEWGSLYMSVQSLANRWLGILWLISIPLSIVWVIMLIKGRQWLIAESIRTGWTGTKKYIGKWTSFIIGYIIVSIALMFLLGDGLAYTLSSQILWILFAICIYSAIIQFVYYNQLAWKDYFDIDLAKVIKYIWWMIVYWILVIVWFILFIVPGVIIMVRGKFFTIWILKDGLWPIAALKNSRNITRGHFWELVWLWIIQGLIQIAGVIALIIWLFWTISTLLISEVKAYQILNDTYKKSL